MKRTEDKNPSGVELIDHIKKGLSAHEETYVEGAWERFNQKENKKKPIAWIWLSSTAAVLVIGMFILLWDNKQPKESVNQIVKTNIKSKTNHEANDQLPVNLSDPQPAQQDITSKNQSAPATVSTKTGVLTAKNNIDQAQIDQNKSQNPLVSAKKVDRPAQVEVDKMVALTPVKTVDPIIRDSVINSNLQPENQAVTKVIPPSNDSKLSDFLIAETAKNKTNKKDKTEEKKQNKFTLGLVVAPSFGNVKKLNMGYGVSVDYQFSPKFSLNSGIAYNQMAAQGTGIIGQPSGGLAMADAGPSSSSLFSASKEVKTLKSVEERVSGIDIPLELKYHVSKNFYANVGLSAFAVISQRQDNTYVINRAVTVVSQPATLAGKQQLSNVIVSEQATEKETSTNAGNNNYLGFYNFSLGYKQRISKQNSLAIEPFIKLPMQKVNTERLNMVGAGMKLKFDF